PDPRVQVDCRPLGTDLGLAVRDNGCGMDRDQLDRLFVPFAGSFEEGTGLGMSLVFKLAQERGWKLAVQSQPGGGTEVELILPVFPTAETVASTGQMV
ncbi:MAG TPA: ATP-binding protein, partial [Holophagaceae bacterium]